ncbi:MAG: phosphoadenylyl-sulfate reductase [Actinomycetota bacterium]|nr:phosphoadenylyl-sulfate reductase [Actinomycetota bacterium]
MTDTVVNLRVSSPTTSADLASFTSADLAEISAGLETATASEIVAWAVERFHPNLSLTSSMTDAVLIDLAMRVEPSIEVVFIDTGYHFPETLETMERVRRHYGLNLKVMTVAPHDQELWRVDPENCCSALKVGQLDRALAGKAAWMSGLRRAESPSRASAPVVAHDVRGLVKINPLATWDDDDVARYVADHDVPVNPLLRQGYRSIGCAPCTAPAEKDADARSGRWQGSEKTECGLHL